MPERTEQPEDLVEETAEGRSERTPWLALGAVHLVVGAIVLVVLAIAFTAYLLA